MKKIYYELLLNGISNIDSVKLTSSNPEIKRKDGNEFKMLLKKVGKVNKSDIKKLKISEEILSELLQLSTPEQLKKFKEMNVEQLVLLEQLIASKLIEIKKGDEGHVCNFYLETVDETTGSTAILEYNYSLPEEMLKENTENNIGSSVPDYKDVSGEVLRLSSTISDLMEKSDRVNFDNRIVISEMSKDGKSREELVSRIITKMEEYKFSINDKPVGLSQIETVKESITENLIVDKRADKLIIKEGIHAVEEEVEKQKKAKGIGAKYLVKQQNVNKQIKITGNIKAKIENSFSGQMVNNEEMIRDNAQEKEEQSGWIKNMKSETPGEIKVNYHGQQENKNNQKNRDFTNFLKQSFPLDNKNIHSNKKNSAEFSERVKDYHGICRQIEEKIDIKQLRSDSKQIVFKLEPEFLGKVNIKLETEAGRITAKFVVENEYVKNYLESNIFVLQDNLTAKDINLSEINIETENDKFDFNGSENRNKQESNSQQNEFNFKQKQREEFTNNNDNAEMMNRWEEVKYYLNSIGYSGFNYLA